MAETTGVSFLAMTVKFKVARHRLCVGLCVVLLLLCAWSVRLLRVWTLTFAVRLSAAFPFHFSGCLSLLA